MDWLESFKEEVGAAPELALIPEGIAARAENPNGFSSEPPCASTSCWTCVSDTCMACTDDCATETLSCVPFC